MLKPGPDRLGAPTWTLSSTQHRRSQARTSPGLEITIESLNYQLRKVTKNRGHFPNDAAVIKLLWLAICNIEDKRARERAKEKGKPAAERKAPGRLVEGQIVTNWKQALAQLAIVYPDRINPHL